MLVFDDLLIFAYDMLVDISWEIADLLACAVYFMPSRCLCSFSVCYQEKEVEYVCIGS